MAELMLTLGVLFLIGGIALEHPKLKRKFFDPWEYQDRKQYEERILNLKGEVEKLKEDVVLLLAEIDRASEGIAERLESLAGKASQEESPNPRNGNTVKSELRTGKKPKVSKMTVTSDHLENQEIQASHQSVNGIHGEIMALANKGLSVEEIARRLKKGKGEVDLILQLQGKGD